MSTFKLCGGYLRASHRGMCDMDSNFSKKKTSNPSSCSAKYPDWSEVSLFSAWLCIEVGG